jgi:putative thioredoxin
MTIPLLSPTSSAVPSVASVNECIKDVTLKNFIDDVIKASQSRPIIVDFWAPWCGPCKQLTPTLEKLVMAARGAISLAKIDIDRDPEIAQQMGVQSIPAVFAFFQGRPVDGFMGALPETQVKAFIDKLLKLAVTNGLALDGDASDTVDLNEALKHADESLLADDIETADVIYRDVLDQDPSNVQAHAGLIKCFLSRGDASAARNLLDSLSPDIAKDKKMDSVRTALELTEQAKTASPVDELLKKISSDPTDLQSHFDLAMAYYAAGQREQAVDELLDIARRNRTWNDDAARKQLVKFFEAFGVMDPLTIAARRRLSSIMYS